MAMRHIKVVVAITWLLAGPALAENLSVDNFDADPNSRWTYVSDQVMGGVSEGRVEYVDQGDDSFARLTGLVSTENNGGFIQVRRTVAKRSVDSALGVYVKARGNSQEYYIHLRTSGTVLPWQYYQAGFEVTKDWQTIRLPLSDFERSSAWLGKIINPKSIRSVGVLAYGRDHQAEIEIAEVGFYR